MTSGESQAEKESPRKVYALGQEFSLFDSTNFPLLRDLQNLSYFDLNVDILDVDSPITLPFRIQATTNTDPGKVIDIITAGHPEKGYSIDERDFNPDQRREKINKLIESGWKPDITEDPVGLSIKTLRHYSYKEAGVYELGSPFDDSRIPEKFYTLLKKLVLVLAIPGSENRPSQILVSRPTGELIGGGAVVFEYFYPGDFGPLAKSIYSKYMWGLNTGCRLKLPADPSLLQQVSAKINIITLK